MPKLSPYYRSKGESEVWKMCGEHLYGECGNNNPDKCCNYGGNHTAACGDFNAHNTMWRDQEDLNGKVIEEILDDKALVC